MVSEIKNILVVGAGVMGHGIALCYAQAGYNVWVNARRQSSLDHAKELIRSSLDTMVEAGLVASEDVPATVERIHFTTSLEEAARGADYVIETVVEDGAVKKEVFEKLDRLCRHDVVLASNTTALNVFDIAPEVRPDKMVIQHWYTPPQLIPLVDVVKGPNTKQETVDVTLGLLRQMGKQPVVMNKFVSGYVVPRLQMALNREIFYLLDNDYISPADLDEAVKAGLALRMLVLGVVRRADFGGLDLTARGLRNPQVQNELAPADYKPRKIFELVEQGHYGVKAGRGFFDYSSRSESEYYRERDLKLLKVLKTYRDIQATQF